MPELQKRFWCVLFSSHLNQFSLKKAWISEIWMRTGLNEFQFDRKQVWYLNTAIVVFFFFFFLECFCYATTILNKITYIVSILKMMRSQVLPPPVTAHAVFFLFSSVSWNLDKFIFKPNNTTPGEKPFNIKWSTHITSDCLDLLQLWDAQE